MVKLSVYIVTYNEELRLERTLEKASQVADEIVVVDSGSEDNTVEIAKKYGAKVYHNAWKTYCDQKNFAENKCSYDHVLLIDADEVLSDELIKEINLLKEDFKLAAYKIKIVDMLPHDIKPSCFAQTFNPVRLYNRKLASMPKDKMNKDRVEVKAGEQIGQLKGKILHYSFLSLEKALEKFNRHSTELQKTLAKENKSFSTLRLVTEYPRQFCRYYIGKGYIFRGTDGFICASVMAYFRYLKIAKWFESRPIKK